MLKSVEWNGSVSDPDYIGYGEDSILELKRLIPGCQNVMINMRTDVSGNTVTPRYTQEDQYNEAFSLALDNGLTIIARMKTKSFWGWFPSDLNAFMESFGDAAQYWAALCEQYSIPYFVIGNEFEGAEDEEALWMGVINKVRAVYNGQITYLTSWWRNTTSFNKQKNRSWYHSLDFLSISPYWPYMGDPAPTEVQVLENNWHSSTYGESLGHDIVVELEEWANAYGKQVMFMGGIQSGLGAFNAPWNYTSSLPVSLDTQEFWYEAFFRVFFTQPWVFGITWDGAWNHRKRDGGSWDSNTFDVNNKPAQDVLDYWYSMGNTVWLHYNSVPVSVNALINNMEVPSGAGEEVSDGATVRITVPERVEDNG